MRDAGHACGVTVSRSAPGALQRLLTPFVNPGTLDFWAQHLRSNWSWDRPLATVEARHVEARDTVTLTLRPNRLVAWPKAGQHVNISVEVNGRRTTRSYSPTRIDRQAGTFDITVKHIPQGAMSTHLCHAVHVGGLVEVGEVFGHMTWPATPAGKWLLLAAGSGITPMISLLRQAQAAGSQADVVLIYAARQRADLCFLAELNQLAQREPGFKLQLVLSRETELLNTEVGGRINADLIQSQVGDLAERQVLACGPAGFVDTARALTAHAARRFDAEAFTPPVLAAAADDAAAPVRVVLQQSGRTVTVNSGEPLLPALEAHGLQVPFGCRMGVCNTCSCAKVSGTTRNMQSGELDAEPDSAVRLCIASARSDLTLDL